jgi:hypothetical protein
LAALLANDAIGKSFLAMNAAGLKGGRLTYLIFFSIRSMVFLEFLPLLLFIVNHVGLAPL